MKRLRDRSSELFEFIVARLETIRALGSRVKMFEVIDAILGEEKVEECDVVHGRRGTGNRIAEWKMNDKRWERDDKVN